MVSVSSMDTMLLLDDEEYEFMYDYDAAIMNVNHFDDETIQQWIQETRQEFLITSAQIPSILLEHERTTKSLERGLQSNSNVTGPGPLNVELTCEGYNANPGFNCTCRRVLAFDVLVECDMAKQLCTAPDNKTCFEQSFAAILDGATANGTEILRASRMTSCTRQYDIKPIVGPEAAAAHNKSFMEGGLNITILDDDTPTEEEFVPEEDEFFVDANGNMTATPDFIIFDKDEYDMVHTTCVEIQPKIPGFFNESIRCGASLNGKLCKGCSQCTASGNSLNGSTTITVDCCNVVKDAKQTCGYVAADSGFVLPVFDAPGTHKGCSGATRTTIVVTAMTTILGVCLLLLL